MGCEGLSHPGATDRIRRLSSFEASNAQTPDSFYDSKYYVDDKTPHQRLDEQFDKVDNTVQ
ncbi:MAG TPA: hypothetical protein DCM28_04335 [Phycisphaerales bacterium]|nr:hypothetical protein [Phycisphaerales bacterium]HCD33962.1 hypothetical protein [Phycisphaerales bacterium]